MGENSVELKQIFEQIVWYKWLQHMRNSDSVNISDFFFYRTHYIKHTFVPENGVPFQVFSQRKYALWKNIQINVINQAAK